MPTDNDIEHLLEYIAAQDHILRETLAIFVALGEASGAWPKETSDSAMELLADVLDSKAASCAKPSARVIAYTEFARYAREWRQRSQSQSRPRSDEGLQ